MQTIDTTQQTLGQQAAIHAENDAQANTLNSAKDEAQASLNDLTLSQLANRALQYIEVVPSIRKPLTAAMRDLNGIGAMEEYELQTTNQHNAINLNDLQDIIDQSRRLPNGRQLSDGISAAIASLGQSEVF